MPELAEVEYFRRRWDPGLGALIVSVELHAEKRIFRGTDTGALRQELPGAKLLSSEARGKQMAFRFSRGLWIAIHLGMTGRLQVAPGDFVPGKHDHLVLRQRRRTLVFTDPRQFGRVLFFPGPGQPPWWSGLPPALTSASFTRRVLRDALQRHRRLPIKGTLLLQAHFPGVGNWMADEILWRARIHPRTCTGGVEAGRLDRLWRSIRFVCLGALRHVSKEFSDPPPGWLFHERWSRHGQCPRDGAALERDAIGGRTTAWCPRCQREREWTA